MRISDWSSDVCSSDLALVFGRELTGLENDELQLCHAAVHIPANPDYSSLNLAAAVQVLAYELRVALLDADTAAPAPDGHGQGGHADPTARHAQMERSEERRVGKECVRKCRSRGSPDP